MLVDVTVPLASRPAPERRRGGRDLGVAIGAISVVPALCLGYGLGSDAAVRGLSLVVATTLVLLALQRWLLAHPELAHPRRPTRAWRSLVMDGCALMCPLLALTFYVWLRQPLVAMPPWMTRAPLVGELEIAGAASCGVALASTLRALSERSASRWAQHVLRGACAGAVAMGLVLVALAGVHSRAPAPEHYFDSLELAGALPAAGVLGAPTRVDPGAPWSWEPVRVFETEVPDGVMTRVCGEHVCGLVLGRSRPGEGLWGPGAVTSMAQSPLVVRRDARHALWIVQQSDGVRALRDGALTEIRVADHGDDD